MFVQTYLIRIYFSLIGFSLFSVERYFSMQYLQWNVELYHCGVWCDRAQRNPDDIMMAGINTITQQTFNGKLSHNLAIDKGAPSLPHRFVFRLLFKCIRYWIVKATNQWINENMLTLITRYWEYPLGTAIWGPNGSSTSI